jgi:hypothetical protein
MNVRGPCSSCGAQLATDQRYCVECGQRVGPPLALPYALPTPVTELPAAGRWTFALPIPIQMASTFAAIALGFGVVVGTAISPNVGGILAATPAPTVVAQAPPPATSTAPAGGGGGGGASAPAPSSAPVSTFASTGSGGGGGGGGGGTKKKKKQKEQPVTFTGTVVRANPVAQSYTIASNGGLISIHAAALPIVGAEVKSPVRKLKNGTYAEQGVLSQTGTTDNASFLGTVTYCADLEDPSAACDAGTAGHHYVYAVSSSGASVLVSTPAAGATPKLGSQVQVGVHIGATFQQVAPTSGWPPVDSTCNPPWDEQHGLPATLPATPELTQTSVTVNGQGTNALLDAVVQTSCQGPPRLVLSADDIRESGRDLAPLALPGNIDPARVSPGQAVQVALDVADNGTLTLRGITSDQGANGADDPSQGQGTLTGS